MSQIPDTLQLMIEGCLEHEGKLQRELNHTVARRMRLIEARNKLLGIQEDDEITDDLCSLKR